jgi:hypothetical protein
MKMVHTTLRVDFWLIGSRSIGELSASQDVEVVIGGMTACVAFGAHRGACEIFSNTFPRSGKEDKPKMMRYSVMPGGHVNKFD